jgi:hypothetical protein
MRRDTALTQLDADAMLDPPPAHGNQTLRLSTTRPCSETETQAEYLAAFTAAAILARSGDRSRARQLCASVIFEAQPLIATQSTLLRATLHTLLVARGFQLLSRVVNAVSGVAVEVVLLPNNRRQITPPRSHQDERRIRLLMDPRWLDIVTPDDLFLSQWCKALANGTRSGSGAVERPLAARHVETV